MAAGVRRVTVVGSVRRLDLAVPAGAQVAELLPEVVALAGEPGDAAALPRWSLSGFGTGDLSPASSLESAGVPDGAGRAEANGVEVRRSEVAPWFEQLGDGSKYQFFDNGRPLSQAELQRLGIIAEITR